MIADTTGIRPVGWSSPSVYSNGDTPGAAAAEGITYTLDQMDSDIIGRLKTPDGTLVLSPYPVVTVDMGQQLARMKSPAEVEALWLDYVLELAAESRADAAREATTVVIGIHPFVVGTPDGAAAMRRVLVRPQAGRRGLADRHRRHSQGRRLEMTDGPAISQRRGRVQAVRKPT
jgi:hypothetical protein